MLSVTSNGYEIPFVERHRPGSRVEPGWSVSLKQSSDVSPRGRSLGRNPERPANRLPKNPLLTVADLPEFFTPAGHKDLDGAGCSRVASSHSTRFRRLSGYFLSCVRER
jgi:hypothetical protein